MSLLPNTHKSRLQRFAARVPELLAQHESTVALAREVVQLDLANQLDRRFTVAVIGRMKAGKSTLINALIGQRLAPVGINEATATINFFEPGTGACTREFAIHWRDDRQKPSWRPINDAAALVRNLEVVGQIARLVFFADSAFLAKACLVDTPGTMSTRDADEATTLSYLGTHHAERADAFVLVLPTVAGAADRILLELVADETRLPGQGPYNTVAVLQKWETLNHPEPEREAQRLASIFAHSLDGRVSSVLPVSGLLGLMAMDVPEAALDRLAFLATHAMQADLERLTRQDGYFMRDRPGLPLTAQERIDLYGAIEAALTAGEPGDVEGTFPMVKYALFLAHRRGLRTGAQLRAALHEASQLDRLRELMHERFFTVAELIQANAVLSKALDPCRLAVHRLQADIALRRELAGLGTAITTQLAQTPLRGDPALLDRLMRFLKTSVPLLNQQFAPIEATLRELDGLMFEAERDGRLLLADLTCLELLADPELTWPPDLKLAARALCGQSGLSPQARLSQADDTSGADLHAASMALLARLDYVQHAAGRGAEYLCAHLQSRLNRLLDQLEER
jgi:hypothetical protein